ncbi:hypothetical protein M514_13701, partial [Trichuris suis]
AYPAKAPRRRKRPPLTVQCREIRFRSYGERREREATDSATTEKSSMERKGACDATGRADAAPRGSTTAASGALIVSQRRRTAGRPFARRRRRTL